MAKTLFGLVISQRAADFIDGMPAGKLRAQVAKKARLLVHDSRPSGCKKLVGTKYGNEDVWRVRSGDYRILYVIRDTEVIVLDVGHRKDIYKGH